MATADIFQRQRVRATNRKEAVAVARRNATNHVWRIEEVHDDADGTAHVEED
jgi:hypothetical protein